MPEMHRFEIPTGHHWNDVRNKTTNIGQALISSFRAIEQANQKYLQGIFTWIY